MMRLLVTGLEGFVGSTLLEVIGQRTEFRDFVVVTPGTPIDLMDKTTLERAIVETRPDCVLHLAAQSFVPSSVNDPRATYDVNFFGTLNLLETLRNCEFKGRMLYVGSGEVYGWVEPRALPAVEAQPLRPRNPYSVSKAAAELLCYQWTQAHEFDIVMARPFNHIGPRQAEWFVVPDFARQVMAIKLGLREPVVSVGSIDVTRDFTDVRDVVSAYLLLLRQGKAGEVYNVCSGREQSIRNMLERLIAIASVDCRVVSDERRIRPTEHKRMYGSYEKLRQQTGWRPMIEFDQSLTEVLAHWEIKLKHV
jgi:GDP-4-dehydro-6-deoxy-D-mannose reductase